ncbi:hypothetical protein HY385_01415 [Candidatus Daviesbacteria bacterium]|nr:hypothetical protein [Candidatus Daviesbacteria bacterium]
MSKLTCFFLITFLVLILPSKILATTTTIDKPTLNQDEFANIRITDISTQYHHVKIDHKESTNKHTLYKQSYFKANKKGSLYTCDYIPKAGTYAINELSVQCGVDNDTNLQPVAFFSLQWNFFPSSNKSETYILTVETIGNDGYIVTNKTETYTLTVNPIGGPGQQFLTITLDPASVQAKENRTITINIKQTTVGQKYDIEIPNNSVAGPIKIQTQEATDQVLSVPFSTYKDKSPYFTGQGDYIITVTEHGFSAKFGQATLHINPQPLASNCKPGDQNCSSAAGDFCDPPANTQLRTALGCISTKPTDFIQTLLKFAIGIGGGIALLLMIAGAFQMMTSGGNPESLKKGTAQITSAAIGLLFIIFSVMLLQIIGVDILNLPGFGK